MVVTTEYLAEIVFADSENFQPLLIEEHGCDASWREIDLVPFGLSTTPHRGTWL